MRPLGAAADGGKGFKGRARVSGESPIGAASFRQQYNQASCQTPLATAQRSPVCCSSASVMPSSLQPLSAAGRARAVGSTLPPHFSRAVFWVKPERNEKKCVIGHALSSCTRGQAPAGDVLPVA